MTTQSIKTLTETKVLDNNYWHSRKRVFLELVYGCRNLNCSTPCAAYNRPLDFMLPALANTIIEKLSMVDVEVWAFGSGDSSTYPYEKLEYPIRLSTSITGDYFPLTYNLSKMPLDLYLRCDSKVHAENIPPPSQFIGVHIVLGKALRNQYVEIATTLLDKGVPIQLRSAFYGNNRGGGLPVSLKTALVEMEHNGWRADRLWSGKWPCRNCKVATIFTHKGRIGYRRCGMHKTIYYYESLDEIINDICLWDGSDDPVDMCLSCKKDGYNYRIYYEPTLVSGAMRKSFC